MAAWCECLSLGDMSLPGHPWGVSNFAGIIWVCVMAIFPVASLNKEEASKRHTVFFSGDPVAHAAFSRLGDIDAP